MTFLYWSRLVLLALLVAAAALLVVAHLRSRPAADESDTGPS